MTNPLIHWAHLMPFLFHLVPAFLNSYHRAQIQLSEEREIVIKWSEYWEVYAPALKEDSDPSSLDKLQMSHHALPQSSCSKCYSATLRCLLWASSSTLSCCIMAGWCKLVNIKKNAAAPSIPALGRSAHPVSLLWRSLSCCFYHPLMKYLTTPRYHSKHLPASGSPRLLIP